MKIGVISDTHNYLDPRIERIFNGVEHILHGGDIGRPDILAELGAIAPVTAVSGNTDDYPGYQETQIVLLSGLKFLVHHIVTPGDSHSPIHQRIAKEAPHVVVFGHTHKPYARQIGRTFFFNPGYAGKERFSMARSVALFTIKGAEIAHQYVDL